MFENVVISNLINNENYTRKVLAFLKKEYFEDSRNGMVYEIIEDFVNKYTKPPTKEAIVCEIQEKPSLSDEQVSDISKMVSDLPFDENVDLNWVVNKTEKFCQDRAIYLAIMKSIKILDNSDEKNSKGMIPEILSDALAVSFDTNIGHDFLKDSEDRYEYYHHKEKRIPFDLDYMNKITNGGLPTRTLNIIMAGTNVGKSLFMCHCAASNLMNGYNVLYITLEMAEKKIAERIDANLLNTPLNEIKNISKETYDRKIQRIREKTTGKLIVKEYPTAAAGAAHFRHLLNELKIKTKFVPDIIYIDYLNICISSRLRHGSNINSYTYVKSIAEELRGLAVEFDVPIISATQVTRSGFTNTDIGLEDTSESFGLPATADFMFALITSDELQELNQIMVKQLKNRYNDPSINKKFVIGVDKSRMKFYDVEQEAQEDISNDDEPIFDKSNSGVRVKSEKKFDFKGFK